MKTSEQIDQIATALSLAQGNFTQPKKNRINPHFKNKYADLTECIDVTQKHLALQGLSVTQGIKVAGDGHYLITRLLHKTGQFIETETPLKLDKQNMQGLGSALTYARRYAYQAILGINSEDDDDGNDASKDKDLGPVTAGDLKNHQLGVFQPANKPPPNISKVSEAQLKRLFAICREHAWSHEQVKLFIKQLYNLDSTTHLNQDQYNAVIACIEKVSFIQAMRAEEGR